jgi:hypothetical protein
MNFTQLQSIVRSILSSRWLTSLFAALAYACTLLWPAATH